MARIDDLVARISEPRLQRELASELAELRRQLRFGLVFEKHVPEVIAVPNVAPAVGDAVRLRTRLNDDDIYRVLAIEDGHARLQSAVGAESDAPLADLHVVRAYGEPTYPALTLVGALERGGDKPYHAVVNADNLQALELMTYVWEGQADVIYIDPPYLRSVPSKPAA